MREVKKDTVAEHQSILSENISVIFIPSSFSPSLCAFAFSVFLSPELFLRQITTEAESIHLIYVHTFGLHVCCGSFENIYNMNSPLCKTLCKHSCSELAAAPLLIKIQLGSRRRRRRSHFIKARSFFLSSLVVPCQNLIRSTQKTTVSLIKRRPRAPLTIIPGLVWLQLIKFHRDLFQG